MNVLNKLQSFVYNKLQLSARRQQLKKQYVDFSHSVLVKYIMPNLNSFVRHLIVEKGLNPDYVSPPPVVHEPSLTFEQVKDKLTKIFASHNFMKSNYTESWVRESFKDMSKHPVYKSRAKFEQKQTQPAPLEIVIDEPLQVAIGSDAIENLRAAVKHIEETVVLPKPEKATVKPKRPRRRKKTHHGVVTKNFNGNFRRVDDR